MPDDNAELRAQIKKIVEEQKGTGEARRMGRGMFYTLITLAQICGSVTAVYAFAGPVLMPPAKVWAEGFIKKTMDTTVQDLVKGQANLAEKVQTMIEG